MSSMEYLSLAEIVTKDRATFPINQGKFWSLNLDQIESNSGKVLSWHESTLDNLGSSTYFFTAGTVLYSKLRPYLNKVVLADRDGYATTELVPIKCNEKIAFPPYIAHFLRSSKFLKFAENLVAGAKMPRMVMSEFWKYKIPLPPIDEQRRIAAILDKAEALRSKRREAIAKLDQLLQSVFLEMFGDPKDNPKKFSIHKLSDFYDELGGARCGPFGTALKKSDVLDSGVPLWNMDNISIHGEMHLPFRAWVSEEKSFELSAYEVRNRDVLISRAGTVGKMCVVRGMNKKTLMTTNLIRLRLNEKLIPEYFVSLLIYFKGRVGRLKTGPDGSFTHMSTGVLDDISFPCPPMDLQEKWLGFKNKVTKEKQCLEKQSTQIEILINSISGTFFKH